MAAAYCHMDCIGRRDGDSCPQDVVGEESCMKYEAASVSKIQDGVPGESLGASD